MTRLEYLGEHAGKWKGKETCHWYEFPKERRVQWVDKRDVPHLLEQLDADGEALFRRV